MTTVIAVIIFFVSILAVPIGCAAGFIHGKRLKRKIEEKVRRESAAGVDHSYVFKAYRSHTNPACWYIPRF